MGLRAIQPDTGERPVKAITTAPHACADTVPCFVPHLDQKWAHLVAKRACARTSISCRQNK